jgi:hypothetical protein
LIQLNPSATVATQGTGELPAAAADTAQYVQSAMTTLAESLNVPVTSVALLSINAAQWPDSSLGCPQPGQAYVPGTTQGYVIILRVQSTDYEVHADTSQHTVVCTLQSGGAPTPTPPDPVVSEFIQQAKTNLATQLSISPDSVVVVSSEAVDWSDGNLGCKPASKGTTPEPGPISGYRIILAVDVKYYEYHTSFDQIVLCKQPNE